MTATISGVKTVTTAGTAVALGSQVINGLISIKALPANTGNIVIGNNGSNDVTISTAFLLTPGEERIMEIGNLADVYVDSAVNGEGVSWLKLDV